MKLAAVGTFAWDRIRDLQGNTVYRGPGGLIHSLGALAALAAPGDSILPISRAPLAAAGELEPLLDAMVGVDPSALSWVETAPYTVELRYHDQAQRCETATGIPPPFAADELLPWVREADALLFNFISGHEVDPTLLPSLRAACRGPMVVDLHSLTLNPATGGRRGRRQALPGWRTWLAGVDLLQVNLDEAATLAGQGKPPAGDSRWLDELAAQVLDNGIQAFVVTAGAEGATLFLADQPPCHVAAPPTPGFIDPTGCGDVHGAALLVALARGLSPIDALALAAQAAAVQSCAWGFVPFLPDLETLTQRAGL